MLQCLTHALVSQASIYSKEGVMLSPVVSTDTWIWCCRAKPGKEPYQVVRWCQSALVDVLCVCVFVCARMLIEPNVRCLYTLIPVCMRFTLCSYIYIVLTTHSMCRRSTLLSVWESAPLVPQSQDQIGNLECVCTTN